MASYTYGGYIGGVGTLITRQRPPRQPILFGIQSWFKLQEGAGPSTEVVVVFFSYIAPVAMEPSQPSGELGIIYLYCRTVDPKSKLVRRYTFGFRGILFCKIFFDTKQTQQPTLTTLAGG